MIVFTIRYNKRTRDIDAAMGVDVSAILYSIIDNIGREKIRADVYSEIRSSEEYCNVIIAKCKDKLNERADEETLVMLCEGLLHFMLTAALLPSERKLAFNRTELDVVVPSLRMLARSPKKSLVIQIIKKKDEIVKITQAESVQPCNENIWLVSAQTLPPNHRSYHPCGDSRAFSKIIADIHMFTMTHRIRGLSMLP